ncbi:MAG: hypothetical protein LC785_02890 [Acidobacteria bacterium]|nr:hypothetical protein [Acidobacteriota bacterium]MCA1640931.1 hypothetical protein [Acidobacteriota bacterium]
MRRNILPATLLLASCAVFFGACSAGDTRVTNATAGGNSNAAANANAAAGAREGAGAHDTGIGGTGEGRRDATVAGNSNVEPTGVNKNAGKTTNGNRP